MKKMRSILSVVISLCILTTLVFPAYAESDMSTEDKANILNLLSIVKGNGIDYNLDGVLKRSEAVTFIIRILGKEKYVTDNQNKYKATKFPDVKSTMWYAPFIGYCAEQNIIAGYLNGKFGPDDVLTEKAFLKLMMSAIGYSYGTDFTWDNVYASAYSVGLVTDESYQDKEDDNDEYTRGDVVEVLYNSLTLKKKDSQTTVIQSLVNDGIITEDIAHATGILIDTTQTAVENITVLDETSVYIKLNEDVENVTKDNIIIYETKKTANLLDVTIDSQTNGEIIVKTSRQAPDTEYSVEIVGIVDKEGNTSDSLTGSFIGFRAPDGKSDFFKISKIEPLSKNVVNLYFTHPVNVNSEIPSYYEILENEAEFVKGSTQTMTVKLLNTANNGVTIYLKEKTFTEGADYTLKVSGDLNSVYGVKINDGEGDSIKFTGKGAENEELKMSGVVVLSSNTLTLEFNKDINPVLAQQIYNYYITDANDNPIQIKKAILSNEEGKKGRVVVITVNGTFDKTKDYKFTINNINDITRQYSITETVYSFSGYYPSKTDITVENVTPLDAGTLVVYFDRPLDATSAVIASNYLVTGITHTGYTATPAKVYYDASIDPYAVKLYMPADKLFKGTYTYKIKIMSTLQDYLGNMQSKILESGFNSSGSTTVKPTISEATIIAKDTIKVRFSKEVAAEAPNLLTTNYTLEFKDSGVTLSKMPVSVNYINASTFALKFDSLDFATSYTLKFNSLKDYSGIYTSTQSDGNNSVQVVVGK